ncbi:MAG: U32 family peptidase [Polyangiaceae bacterium]|nr:U32 family peptidase [Polyangiaceae bacterium]
MKLSVAANWDFALLEGLAGIPEVTSIYAKLPYDLVGGGRAGAVVPEVDWATATAYVRAARERGLSFCYLINAPCLGNLEQTHEGKERLLAFVGRLVEMGVDSVSISNLALVALVRRNFPGLAIRGSVLSWATNLPRLKYQESMGVDPLILPYSEFNRDFRALERIRAGVSCGLTLFANISCIYHCSYLAEHAASVGHASQEGVGQNKTHALLDSYLWQCARRRLVEPEQFLMSRWIRPEDLHVYEELGYDEFKIIDRSRGTPWLLRAASAYAARRYDGNLLDIVSLETFGDPAGFHPSLEAASKKRLPLLDSAERRLSVRMIRLRQRMLGLGVVIDNAALGSFLEGFRKIDCAETFCDDCRYCHRFADKAVRYDRAEAERLVGEVGALVDEFMTAQW